MPIEKEMFENNLNLSGILFFAQKIKNYFVLNFLKIKNYLQNTDTFVSKR